MGRRRSLKVEERTFDRFAQFKRGGENQTGALARLLDEAGVDELLRCEVCLADVQAFARDDDGRMLCFDCAGVSEDELPD